MATLARRPQAQPNAERRFYLGMGLLILAIMFAGFAPSFYLRGMVPVYAPYLPMSAAVLFHGLLFTGWLLLFIAQVGLVSARRPDIHRKLGLAAFAMLPAMVIVAFVAAIGGVARHSGPPELSPLTWLAVPLLDIPVFTSLIAAALYSRRNAQVHKRLMLCALISLTPPGTGRLPGLTTWLTFPGVMIGSQLLLLAALAAWDLKSRGRIHKVTAIATLVIVGSWVGRLLIWESAPWLAFASWISSFA
jgi:hypothetical protein